MSVSRRRLGAVVALGAISFALAGTGQPGLAAARPSGTAVHTVSGTSDPLTPYVPPDVVAASSGAGSTWKPEAATYGTATTSDVGVTMADGTVLRVNIVYPTDLASGNAAPGPFPVLLTQTPYGKGAMGADAYLVQRGYIEVVADVRGTGDSGGTWGLFDPLQWADGVELIHWCATAVPHTNGIVGTFGASYLGIDQLLTASRVGRNSPLKAMFPVVAATDLYTDTSFMGGILNNEFDTAYLGLTGALNIANPLTGNPGTVPTVEQQHLAGIASYHVAKTAEIESGGPAAYNDPGGYWASRSPGNVLQTVVDEGIPAFLVGGEFDLFQRGEPLNYAGLQNAFSGRPVTAPMAAGQAVTGRYQLVDGPWAHLVGSGLAGYDVLMLEWFDTWLKGQNTGMDRTPTPLHIYDLGTQTWAERATYPDRSVTPTRLYLGPGASGSATLSVNDGTLSTSPPSTSGTDSMVWSPVGSPCSRTVDQWSMGAVSVAEQEATVTSGPCVGNDMTTQAGPWALTYTTQPLTAARTIAGPVAATIYAASTAPDTELVALLQDVAPDGSSFPLTEGALLGQFRALDGSTSWTAADGQYIKPQHTYSQASVQPVPTGQVTRYDIEIFPTYSTIAPGHRIRLTLASVDSPHLAPIPPQLQGLAGGVYTVQRTTAAPSALELLLIGGSGPAAIPAPPSAAGTGTGQGSLVNTAAVTAGTAAGPPAVAALVLGALWRRRRR